MAADEGKKEDQFSFTDQGEALGYISLEQARVVAMRTARDLPGDYGRRFSGVGMVFNVVEQEEGEDYYIVTLSLRPQGDFEGTAGQEQFFIEKEGNVAHRQVLSLPRTKRGGFPAVPVGIGVVVVAVIALVAVVVAGSRGGSNEESPEIAAGSQGQASAPATPTATPITASATGTTPEVERAVDVVPVGHILNVAGFPVEPGQTDIRIANGTVQWSAPPDEDGTYPNDYWVDMEVIPDQDGSEIVWTGVDYQSETVAGVSINNDRYVNVEILLPFVPAEPEISDDHGDSFDDATVISPGSISGTIDPPHDVDVFGFFARAGESYIFEVFPDGHPDTVLSLFQWPEHQLYEVDDTEGMDGGSRIDWTAPEDNDYSLVVRSFDPEFQSGGYILYLDVTAPSQISFTGFYAGTITSFEDGSNAQLELDLDESGGEVFGYLTLYDPHVGSGELESGSISEGYLRFTVSAFYEGVSYYCEYFADQVDEATFSGSYECALTDGTFTDEGEWSAFRQ